MVAGSFLTSTSGVYSVPHSGHWRVIVALASLALTMPLCSHDAPLKAGDLQNAAAASPSALRSAW